MAELLRKLGATRAEVGYVPGSAPDPVARARLHLTSEALRPAESTDRWERLLAVDGLAAEGRASLANALAGIRLVVAPTAHDEAEAIALMLRSAVETPGKTAALVTPDRTLARRVAARLKRYELAVDDSAGVPVARTVPGAFLDLVLGAIETNFAPPELMALLKHPLALLGRSPGDARSAARALERGAFRGVYVGEGLSRRAGGASRRAEARRGADSLALTPRGARSGASSGRGSRNRICAARRVGGRPLPQPAARLAEAHAAVAEALALRYRRLVVGALAGRGRGSPFGAAGRTDRRRARPRARRLRLPALLSEPRRRRSGAAARGVSIRASSSGARSKRGCSSPTW